MTRSAKRICSDNNFTVALTTSRADSQRASETPGSGAFLSSRCGHGPSRVCNDTTQDSRNESIGGFVTWAKRCRKSFTNQFIEKWSELGPPSQGER